MTHSLLSSAVASALVVVLMTSPAVARVHTITIDPATGSFTPKYANVKPGDTVTWSGLGRTDSVVGVGNVAAVDANDACFVPSADPTHVNPYRRAFDPALPNELTGPTRDAVSGIWALGPEGDSISNIEIPSAEAEAIAPGINGITDPAVERCGLLDTLVPDVDDGMSTLWYRYGPLDDSIAIDPGGASHALCGAITLRCDLLGDNCVDVPTDPTNPSTIPPGTYANGLMTSTYANPDLTGVVLRFNWKNLQVDRDGVITSRWDELDRELERAIAHGKLVTLDIRAGMFGTPPWIFTDYLDAASADHAPWCTVAGCGFVDAHPAAGTVEAITFVDYYDEPGTTTCGSQIRLGAPGDPAYRDLYKDLIARVAAHVAEDSRRFNAVAHVKISGANLRTSEAELPHHCDDGYAATADHQLDPKAAGLVTPRGDGVLDVFKSIDARGVRKTSACACNPKIWYDHGYTPQELFDYYAQVEHQIVTSFFGRKSLGYQILQDGFPRADSGGFLGDHLYEEVLVDSTTLRPQGRPPATCGDGIIDRIAGEECDDQNLDDTDGCFSNCRIAVKVNQAYQDGLVCSAPDVDPVTLLPAVHEDRVTPSVSYCSSDLATLPAATSSLALALVPLQPDLAFPFLAAHDTSSGSRFPASSAQSEQVLDEAGNGRFGDPTWALHTDRVLGKLFTPQHSGLQPLSQERVSLGYPADPGAPSGTCRQQRARVVAPAPAQGPYVAAFPIPEGTRVSTLSDADTGGCPNQWIVRQGFEQDRILVPQVPTGPLPPPPLVLAFPPQLTGFQTTNKVRSPRMVESALFNLVYNTNAVFVELYEDAIWRIATRKGTGAGAATIDATYPGDLGAPARVPGGVCDEHTATSDLCYSKRLSEWAAELHARRTTAASLWQSFNGVSYPALADPFPTSYSVTFTNPTGVEQYYSYINPSRCLPANVLSGAPLLGPSALGVIRVAP